MIWRLVTHEQMRQSYAEICSSWNLDDVDDGNAVCDAYDVAIETARAQSERKAG